MGVDQREPPDGSARGGAEIAWRSESLKEKIVGAVHAKYLTLPSSAERKLTDTAAPMSLHRITRFTRFFPSQNSPSSPAVPADTPIEIGRIAGRNSMRTVCLPGGTATPRNAMSVR